MQLVEVVRAARPSVSVTSRCNVTPVARCAASTPRPTWVAEPQVNTLELDLLRRGVRYRVLYDRHGLELPGRLTDLEAGLAHGEQARVADVPLKLVLSDYPLALLPLQQDPTEIEASLVVSRLGVAGRPVSALRDVWTGLSRCSAQRPCAPTARRRRPERHRPRPAAVARGRVHRPGDRQPARMQRAHRSAAT